METEYRISTREVLFNNGKYSLKLYVNERSGNQKLLINGIDSTKFELVVVDDIAEKVSPYNPKAKARLIKKGERFPVVVMLLLDVSLMYIIHSKKHSTCIYSTFFDILPISGFIEEFEKK